MNVERPVAVRGALFFRIAGLTVEVEADAPVGDAAFAENLLKFRVEGPGDDNLLWRHHFSLPDIARLRSGRLQYRNPPWEIYRHPGSWAYVGIMPSPEDPFIHRAAVFNPDHTRGDIYSPGDEAFRTGGVGSLSLFPSDQIVLARVLAERQGCYVHAAGMIINGRGLLFVGHSEAGKSTVVTLLRQYGEILCDDRIIIRRVRRRPHGFEMHGTWSHGDVADVSPAGAPLAAILLLEQAPHNLLVPVENRREIVRRLPFFVVKPLITADWWEKTLDLVGMMAREAPVYRLQFDKSGRVRDAIEPLIC